MPEEIVRCVVCGGLVDEEDLFCGHCGAEAPDRAATPSANAFETSQHSFLCDGCGASLSYDASAQALRCPFCGSERLESQPEGHQLAARSVVRFYVDRAAATRVLREWLGRGFWRPRDLSEKAAVTKMTPVFVPYWVFQANTSTYWTADSSETPFGARGDWIPMSGSHQGTLRGLLVGASATLTPQETAGLCPFDLSAAEPMGRVDLTNWIVEQFRVHRKYARPQARRGMEELEREACRQHVPGRSRNLQVNVRLENMSSEAMLLPVWMMAYRYKKGTYRFLINGQTGQAHGRAPLSLAKIVAAAAILIAIVALALSIFARLPS